MSCGSARPANRKLGSTNELTTRFRKSFLRYLNHSRAETIYRDCAAIVLDVFQLANLSRAENDDRYANKLIEYRQSKTASLEPPPNEVSSDVVWRLMRDGRQNPSTQVRIAKTIQAWKLSSEDPIDRIERLVWLGQLAEAKQTADEFIGQSKSKGQALKQVAVLLGAQSTSKAKTLGIQYWDRLASGVPKNSQTWHESKIAGIELLVKTSQTDEARKRAKYILLTSPPGDQDLANRYKAITEGF